MHEHADPEAYARFLEGKFAEFAMPLLHYQRDEIGWLRERLAERDARIEELENEGDS